MHAPASRANLFLQLCACTLVKGNGQRLFSEKDLPSGDEKRALYELGKSILENYFYTEIGMDHFALPDDKLFRAAADGSLHRNFMGYTDHRTSVLIGLGVSAISDTGNAYTQNEKSLAAYQEKVRQGKLPVFRGHMLTKEDLRLRKHILRLMCQFETSWDKADVNCDAISESLQRLQEPEHDGLVEVRPNGVTVTQKESHTYGTYAWLSMPGCGGTCRKHSCSATRCD